jgi:hypothetical protein
VNESEGALDVNSSTLVGNTTSGDGGAIKVEGSASVAVVNSTLSGNEAKRGGAVAVVEGASANFTNSTVTENEASNEGGGVFSDVPAAGVTLRNTILYGNSAPFGSECAGEVASLGHNAIGAIDGCILGSGVTFNAAGADGDIFDDPELGPLQDNGGPTATYAITDSSPAFDAGDNAGCPATDQRGITRPQGAACDIGAFELEVAVETGLFGDVDCDEDVDSVDSLKILRHVAQLTVNQGPDCPEIASEVPTGLFGDVACDDDVDSVDALFILRYVAFLLVNQPQGCREIGT